MGWHGPDKEDTVKCRVAKRRCNWRPFVERHIRIGIEALRLIRRHGKSVKHLRFDE
jgi:hypothetical protein